MTAPRWIVSVCIVSNLILLSGCGLSGCDMANMPKLPKMPWDKTAEKTTPAKKTLQLEPAPSAPKQAPPELPEPKEEPSESEVKPKPSPAKPTHQVRHKRSHAVWGDANFSSTENGVWVTAPFRNVPPGWHGLHIHERGSCIPPDFTSAGPHFNPTGAHHGNKNPNGPHAGDLPNVYANASGVVKVRVLARGVTLEDGPNSLLDGNGSALVLHENPDDERTDPAGNSGKRIGCAAIH